VNVLHIKNRYLFAQSLFFAAHLLLATSLHAADFFTGPLTKISELGYGKDVFLVKDAQGKKYILKYNTKSSWDAPNTEPSIHETLGAKIGMDVGININNVQLIPACDTSLQSVDINPYVTKTLHTVVPGKEVDHSTLPYHVNIQLSAHNATQNLQSLTRHRNLCQIAALDLFTCNWDRHNGNLFFDEATNQFYAIDMDWIFNQIYNFSNNTQDTTDKTMYSFVTDIIQSFQHKPFECRVLATEIYQLLHNVKPQELTEQERNALKEIADVLKKLQAMYTPRKLFNEWMNIAQQANYTYSLQKQQYIRYLIAYNYCEITKVLAEINRILSDDGIVSYMQHIKYNALIAWQTAKLQHNLAI
jgi:hypothetical protein